MNVTDEQLAELFTSDSPYKKAADNVDIRKTVTIKAVGTDEYEQDNGTVNKFVWLDLGADKPIKLSKTNGRMLVGALGAVSDWPGRKGLLTVIPYDINGNKTYGWNFSPLPKDEISDDIPF